MYKVYSGEVVAAKVTSGAGFDKFEQIQLRAPDGTIETVRDLIVPTDISLHIASGNQIALGVLRYCYVNFCVSARAREDFFPPTESLLRPMAKQVLPSLNAGVGVLCALMAVASLGMALVAIIPGWLWVHSIQDNFRKRAMGHNWQTALSG